MTSIAGPPPGPTRSPSEEEIGRWLVDRIAESEGLEAASIDVKEPFASLGLGSRAAITLSGDLEDWLGRRLSPTLVYDYPSIEALARHLAGARD